MKRPALKNRVHIAQKADDTLSENILWHVNRTRYLHMANATATAPGFEWLEANGAILISLPDISIVLHLTRLNGRMDGRSVHSNWSPVSSFNIHNIRSCELWVSANAIYDMYLGWFNEKGWIDAPLAVNHQFFKYLIPFHVHCSCCSCGQHLAFKINVWESL